MSTPVIGIDLGTSNSAVATVEDGRPRIIPSRGGARLTPSIVGFTLTGQRLIGEPALLLTESHPERVAWATKRFIGRRWTKELADSARQLVSYGLLEGPAGDVRIQLVDRVLPLTQISAMILAELKEDAQAFFGAPVHSAVITVPANFNDSQRQATREAAEIAGLHVLRIVNEPTAAAVAYGLQKNFAGRALVFDLGGGTFDVSILDVNDGVFQVLATGGDATLGGEDFDNRIVQWLLAQIDEDLRTSVQHDALSMRRLKVAAEQAKRTLTGAEEAFIDVSDLGDHAQKEGRRTQISTALTRSFFETLSEPLSRRCLDVCEQVMRDAELDQTAIDAVLLVGGMTRVPLVRRLVGDYFGLAPVTGVNPDECVALGAALHASEIGQTEGSALLIDVASQSLGVGVMGGHVRRLIGRNTAIPTVARDVFLPSQAGQTEARIRIYQGEGDTVEGCTQLGEVLLKDLHVFERSEVPLEVVFELSSEGTLSVRATDLTTGMMNAVRIEARPTLSAQEVSRLSREQAQDEQARAQGVRAQDEEVFRRLLDRSEKYALLLQQSALENPSSDAEKLVTQVQSLVSSGREALEARDPAARVELTRQLAGLIGGH